MPEAARVLFVIANYPPMPGGAERHTQRLCHTLHARGNRVRVLTIRYRESQPERVPVWYFPTPSETHLRDLCFAIWVVGALMVLRSRYRQVHWVMTGLQVLVGLPFAAALGMKNVVMLAGCGDIERLRHSTRGRWMLVILRRFADRIIVLNSAMEEELRALGFERERLVLLGCEADPDIFRPVTADERRLVRSRWNIETDAAVIVFCGRLVPGKGLITLIEAFSLLHVQWPKAVLVLAGDGLLAAELHSKVEGAALVGQVQFVGQLPESSVGEILRISDIFVLPSESEGIPAALVEATAVGLPSVVSDIPGTEIILDQIHGLRTKVGDSSSIAASLTALLSDQTSRLRMGSAARQMFLSGYTPDKVAEGHERMFRELLHLEQNTGKRAGIVR
jgi:glycosyltransferase involved in cell wall biosynthesis